MFFGVVSKYVEGPFRIVKERQDVEKEAERGKHTTHALFKEKKCTARAERYWADSLAQPVSFQRRKTAQLVFFWIYGQKQEYHPLSFEGKKKSTSRAFEF